MDLGTIQSYRRATTRADLVLAPGEKFVAGGTWLYSEPQPRLTGLVDITSLDIPTLEVTGAGDLVIGVPCTIAELLALPARTEWRAQPLFFDCASALLASFKIWNTATVLGNICQSFSAAGMVSLCAALDAMALVWRPDGTDYSLPVADLMTGNGTNALAAGELLAQVTIPARSLRATTAYRKIALAELGRSGAVLTGRVDEDGSAVFAITAATLTPTVLRYDRLPREGALRSDVLTATGYYTDPLGTADWRRGVSAVLLEEIRQQLEAAA
ncbi:FAD binding domain-containing protein [Amnibacterium flavum]|uniref:FAD-binding molybdopterin dehydrogenase n=1 Tax=Amnibacterium flavum TaxID=2173173 RepID=A0A2V1HVI2_9MICO|nr:FAD binding domain-containing protein [Amnibacterium flavum]PVZ96351.1 FAD-binding molybdopterin dehydrogenase [Amnibacterium flavum]